MARFRLPASLCLLAFALSPVPAAVVFHDDFDSGPSPLWGNERGSWTTTGGAYYAQIPDNVPPTFTSLPLELKDFAVEFDLYGVSDGGVWLRCDFSSGRANGVLLVTGGWLRTGTGLYWHIVHDDGYGAPINEHAGLFGQGDNVHIRVVVQGDTYAAYLNGSPTPATTLVTSDFTTGSVGLYDFSWQKFDNLTVDVAASLPAVGLSNRSCRDQAAKAAQGRFLFVVWGKASQLDQDSFVVDDGSGLPVKVVAPGYSGIVPGDIVRAMGALTYVAGEPVMTSTPANVAAL